MSKQLLMDRVAFRFQLTEESESGKLVARGEFGYADRPTENRRVYPRAIMERELKRLNDAIEARKVFGECDHPADGKTKLSRVSHLITGLELSSDGQVNGAAEVLNTDAGRTIRAIHEAGGSIGVSSRGYGSVTRNEDGYDVVQEDFQLDTYDFVADPAQKTAYPELNAESKAKPKKAALAEGDCGKPAEKDEGTAIGNPGDDDDKKVAEAAPPALPVEGEGSEGAAPEENADGGGLTAAGEVPKTSNEAEKPRTTEEKYVKGVLTNPDGSCKPNPNAEAVEEPASSAPPPDMAPRDGEAEPGDDILAPSSMAPASTAEAMVARVEASIKAVRLQVLAEAKAAALAELRDARDAALAEVTEERDQLARAVKDLGFNLLARDALAGHPKAKAVIESLGDLTRFADTKALNEVLSLHKAEVKRLTEEAGAGDAKKLRRLHEDRQALSERLQKATDANKTLTAERDAALNKAHGAVVESYLERSISGMPQAIAIRAEFKKLESKSKETVDRLVEGWKHRSTEGRGTSDFARMRRGMMPQRRAPSTVVEDSVRASLPAPTGQKIALSEGFVIDVGEVERLSGK